MMKMKRIMKVNMLILLGGLFLTVQGCKEEELVFPPSVGTDVEVTEKRPTARPNNLTLVSAFNQKIEIHWPMLSDRVNKAVVSYAEGTEKKVLEVTKFDQATIITLNEWKQYPFELQYFTVDGTSSKKTVVNLTPRPFEVIYKLDHIQTDQIDGGVAFIFPKTLERKLDYKITYQKDGVSKEKVVSGAAIDTVIIDKLYDETQVFDFTIAVADAELNKRSSKVVKMSPGILPYKTLVPSFLFNATNATTGSVTWKNTINEKVTVRVDYLSNGMNKSAQITNDLAAGALSFEIGNNTTDLKVTLTGKEGASTTFVPLSEFADKSNWKAKVSDEQPGDGGGPAALIDNNITTFWHSQYSPAILFPHWFIIDFGKQRPLAKIGMIRRSGATNGFTVFNVEVSLDGTNYTAVANGLTFDPTKAEWQDYLFQKVFEARYVRVTITKPKNEGDAFTHLGEFRAFGY
jgi:hypothetical protein